MLNRNTWVQWVILLLTVALISSELGLKPIWAQESAPTELTPAEQTPAEQTTEEPGSPAVIEGRDALDEALKLKVTSEGLRDLNRVIEYLEVALDKGLDPVDQGFAEQMLSDSLMERATMLMQVINTRPLNDQGAQKVRLLVTSDLRRVLNYEAPVPDAYLMFAKLMALPGGDPHEARRVIDEYLQFEGLPAESRAEALVLEARLVKDDDKALANMDEAIKLDPENSDYRLAKALFLRRADRQEEALKAIDESLDLNPEDGSAYILQGEIYRQQNRIDDALASFDEATRLAPQAPGPYQNRGEIYRQQGEFDKALIQFNEVLKLQPGVLLTLLHRAEAYSASGRYPEALSDIDVVLERQPLVDAHRLRAEILAKMNRLEEAIEEMERIVAAIPDQPKVKMQLALYYLVGKRPSKAIEAYTELLEQDPGNFAALQARGDAHLNIGQHAEAIADFTEALELEPTDTTLLNNLAWVLATSPEDELRNGEQALKLATQASEQTEYKTPHILSTLAAAYAEMGDFESAVKWSQKSVDLNDPEHAEQLKKELESYKQKKPWRERQTMEEAEPVVPLVETPQDPPRSLKGIKPEPGLPLPEEKPELDPSIEVQ